MARYLYRPNDPQADELGMIDASLATRSGEAGPHIIRDEMDATRHMADGKYYTSKAKFRQATKDGGCIEIGNEKAAVLQSRKPVPLSRDARRNEIRKAIRQLQGY